MQAFPLERGKFKSSKRKNPYIPTTSIEKERVSLGIFYLKIQISRNFKLNHIQYLSLAGRGVSFKNPAQFSKTYLYSVSCLNYYDYIKGINIFQAD